MEKKISYLLLYSTILILLSSIVYSLDSPISKYTDESALKTIDKVASVKDYKVDFIHTYSGVDKEIFDITINYTGTSKDIIHINKFIGLTNENYANMEFYQTITEPIYYNDYKTCKINKEIVYPDGKIIKQDIEEQNSLCGTELKYYLRSSEKIITDLDLSKEKNYRLKGIFYKSNDLKSYGTIVLSLDSNDFWDKTHSSWYNTTFIQKYNLSITSNIKNIVNFNISNTTCYNLRNTTRLTLNGSEYPFEWKQIRNTTTTDWIEFINNATTDYELYCNATGLVSGTWGNQTVFIYKNNFDDNSKDSDIISQTDGNKAIESNGVFNVTSSSDADFEQAVNFTKAVIDRTAGQNDYYIGYTYSQEDGSIANHFGFGGFSKVAYPYSSQLYTAIGSYTGGTNPSRMKLKTPNYAGGYLNIGFLNTGILTVNVTMHLFKTSGLEIWGKFSSGSANYTYQNESLSGTVFNKGTFALWPYGNTHYDYIDNLYISKYEFNYTSLHGSVNVGALELQPSDAVNTFIGKTPSDLGMFNGVGVFTTINYTITSPNGLLNSSVKLYYQMNDSDKNSIYVNGTSYTNFNKLYSKVTGNLYTWELDDNEVYPATYNYDQEIMENTTHITMTNNNIKIKLENVTNKTFSFFELDAQNSSSTPLALYYCNSSYVGNFKSSNSCTQIYTFNPQVYNHSHSAYSKHIIAPFNINNGLINNIWVTSTSYFITDSTQWNVYAISNIAKGDSIQTSPNAITWTNYSGTVDAHLHQFSLNNGLAFKKCENDTIGQNFCSTFQFDGYDIANLPPSSVNIQNGAGYYAKKLFLIWTNSTPSGTAKLTYFNISLYNSNFGLVKTIKNETYGLNYYIDTDNYTDGSYYIGVRVFDNNSLSTITYSPLFIFDNTPPTINITSPYNATYTNLMILLSFVYTEANVDKCYLTNSSDVIKNIPCNIYGSIHINPDYFQNITVNITDLAGNSNASTSYFYFNGTLAPLINNGSQTYNNSIAEQNGLIPPMDLTSTSGVLLLFVFFIILCGLVVFVEFLKIPILAVLVGLIGVFFGIILYLKLNIVLGIMFIVISFLYMIIRVSMK